VDYRILADVLLKEWDDRAAAPTVTIVKSGAGVPA
jgi:hypothetical protein